MENIIMKSISEKNIKYLNEILTNKNLSTSNIKTCFFIAKDIIKIFGSGNDSEQILKQFNDFCQNTQINNKEGLSKLLQKINSCLYNYSHLPFEKQNELTNKLNLHAKLRTIISVAIDNADLEDEEFINLLIKITKSNLNYENYYYIAELFKNEIMKVNPQKRKIIFDIILNKNVITLSVNTKLSQSRWNVLTNEDILSLDDESYKKAIEISTNDLQILALDIALQQENLTPKKKKAIINYYHYILNLRHFTKKYCYHVKPIEKTIKEDNILNVVYCSRLLSMDDETYEKTLEEIKKCNKPDSYVKVLANDNLTEEQLKFALNLIKEGEVRKHKGQRDDIITNDHKLEVANVAISPVLTSYPIDEYKKILTLINNICEQADKVSYEDFSSNKSKLLFEIKILISRLFYNPTLFSQNIQRLLMAIEAITSSETTNIANRMYNFCNNVNSAYYNDEQYKRILELIKNEEPVNYELLLGKLFTNKNVPFIKDREELIQLAACKDREHIKKLISIYDKEGQYNMSIHQIFNNVDFFVIQEITGGMGFNNRKLIPPHKTKK